MNLDHFGTTSQFKPDEYTHRQKEKDAALWWRFYYHGERPPFAEMANMGVRTQTGRQWLCQMWLGQIAFEQGLFAEAEEHFRQAWLEMQQMEDASHSATLLRHLGRCLCLQGKHEEAEPLYRQAVELHERLGYARNVELEEDFDAFTAHFRMQGKYKEAEELIRNVLAKLEKREKNVARRARYMNNLAVLLCEEGRCEEAEKVYKQVRELTQTFTGQEVTAHAVVLLNQSVLCYKNGRFMEARELFEHAGKILELLPDRSRSLKLLDDYRGMFGADREWRRGQAGISPYLHAQFAANHEGEVESPSQGRHES